MRAGRLFRLLRLGVRARGLAWLAAVLAAAGTMALAGCRSTAGTALWSRAPVLRIGTLTHAPPMAYRDGRHWRGLEIDLARAYARQTGLRPLFVGLEPDELIPALLRGDVDVLMAGLPMTEANRTRVDFAQPYLTVGLTALARQSDAWLFNTGIKIRSARARAVSRARPSYRRHSAVPPSGRR